MPKLLVPVLPSERFYDAVVAAGDLVAERGGLVTFLFTEVRPPEEVFDDPGGRPSDVPVEIDSGEIEERDSWRTQQVAALDEARQILADRGVKENQIDYLFAEYADSVSAAQAIADEATAGAFDIVVLARGYFEEEIEEEGSSPEEIAEAIQRSGVDDIRLLVT